MIRWSPILYRKEGLRKGIPEKVIESAIKQAIKLQASDLPAVLTLRHLAYHVDVPYSFLRNVVSRKVNPYRNFRIRKRSGGFRYVNVPNQYLMRTQKWIDKFILSKVLTSPYSYAFNKGQSIVECAQQHLGCTWLIKIDLRHFFESLSEIQVYHIFINMGYGNLISFEMARLCTKVSLPYAKKYSKSNWRSHYSSKIKDYENELIGHLPQGAPTSPKLANAIVRDLDMEIAEIAEKHGLIFTRYADDITFSTASNNFNRKEAMKIINTIYSILPKYGLRPNPQKVSIIPPGGRKIVLGLLVDCSHVKLPKSFRSKLECHLYFAGKDPNGHAQKRGFNSVLGMKAYLYGLLSYAKQIDPEYVEQLFKKYAAPAWPL